MRPRMLALLAAVLVVLAAACYPLDPSFGNDGKVTADFAGSFDEAHSVVRQPDGRVVAVGSAVTGSGGAAEDFAIARYQDNGTLDAAFGNGGKVLTDFGGADSANDVVLQP